MKPAQEDPKLSARYHLFYVMALVLQGVCVRQMAHHLERCRLMALEDNILKSVMLDRYCSALFLKQWELQIGLASVFGLWMIGNMVLGWTKRTKLCLWSGVLCAAGLMLTGLGMIFYEKGEWYLPVSAGALVFASVSLVVALREEREIRSLGSG